MTRLLGWWAAVAAGEACLYGVGRSRSAAWGTGGLRVADAGWWREWPAGTSPEAAAFGALWLVALVVGAYLLVVLGLGMLVRAWRLPRWARPVDAVTPPGLRALLDRAMGAVAGGAVGAALAVGPVVPVGGAEGPPITLRGLSGPARSADPTTTTTIAPPRAEAPPGSDGIVAVPPPDLDAAPSLGAPSLGAPSLGAPSLGAPPAVQVPPAVHAPPPAEASRPQRSPPTSTAAPPPAPPIAAPSPAGEPPAAAHDPPAAADAGNRTWEVRRGDHFWSIAEHELARAWHRPVRPRDVLPYWRALVEANRSRLADPGNDDLLFAGQVLVLPPVSAPPG